uniref:transaldolase n=1 Tax=Arcella intermedia TaxID=1963864 RepID=A0A6B2LA74_9EUKA|eukprot:TRINITY_DN4866_c0_g1_i1.p1 TRINITY_DN4866_c0_g1~~TRINITY_DN4866_c0_g1_i1.p1  ORF type:complete len:324 (-),score=87.10 TRINITY_DN4866_c0_g1_i1:44-1015(-)
MASQLEQLKAVTTVVADSGDFASFELFKPQDATTNPSLILAAAQLPKYQDLIDESLKYAKEKGKTVEEQVAISLDKLAVTFGAAILKIIPGRVSTELDARLSYDTQGTIAKCHALKQMYQEVGVNTEERVLFKIASTWEGIKAAEQLEKEGIHTNLTLLFSFSQAVACAEAGVTLISPFVGRILDFWKKEKGVASIPAPEDPGVLSVTKIYNYYKKFDYKTIVMGASFRSKEEILELAGVDYMTIAPNWLKALAESNEPVTKKLDQEKAKQLDIQKLTFDEKAFRWAIGQDACATAKLAEGIVKFAEDTEKLEKLIKERLQKL